MEIQRQTLARMPSPYAVGTVSVDGTLCLLAASEAREGDCLIFRPPDWSAATVWSGRGGCMSLVPVPGARPAVAGIQGFFPVFDSAAAALVYAEAPARAGRVWIAAHVADLPFAHRLDVVMVRGQPWAVASTLCGGKDFRDDWSKPGAVYAGPIPGERAAAWRPAPILEGIGKNHGMHVTRVDGRQTVLIAGHEGLFALRVPPAAGERWEIEQWLAHEVSDIFAADLDGDGVVEIAAIEPFHGDGLALYKRQSGEWRRVYSTDLDFGHVVWAGPILGGPALLAGSRGGQKELTLLRAAPRDPFRFVPTVIDRGGGPAQVRVWHEPVRDRILSSNHGAGEVVLYTLQG